MNNKIHSYLKLYNLLSLLGWLSLFIHIIFKKLIPDNTTLYLLIAIQSLALLDIFHAYKKWVKTDTKLAFLQIFARLFILALIYVLFHEDKIILGIGVITLVWSIAEISRYGFYFFSNLKLKKLFTFLRYNAFIILYPTGVFLEFLIGYHWLKYYGFKVDMLSVLVVFVFACYFYFFPKLFGYMWKQRAKRN